ncbi:MAG: hypothetical protein K1X57_18150 [Gemmataceae bacterium]|nr:hypothetical protein [Gemmataceae bacterium]
MSGLPGYLKGHAMLGLFLCIGLNLPGAAPPAEILDRLPGTTRLVIGLKWKVLTESELVRSNGEQLKELFGNVPGMLSQLAVESDRVERIWIVAGDEFPTGSAIVVCGSFDLSRVQARLAEWSRDRRFATRSNRDGARTTYAADLPVGSLPIPGVPTTTHLGLAEERLIIATDRETLNALVAKSPLPESSKVKLPVPAQFWDSTVAGVLVPPAVLTAPDAVLAGVNSATLDASITNGMTLRVRLTTANADSLTSRLAAGAEQVQKLFGPLATQQGIDPRLIALVTELTGKTSISKSEGAVEATAILTADEIAKKTKK